jgi:hypothetical protein
LWTEIYKLDVLVSSTAQYGYLFVKNMWNTEHKSYSRNMLAGENTTNAFGHPRDEAFRNQINIKGESLKVDVIMSELHYTLT